MIKVTRTVTDMTGNAGEVVNPGELITDHHGDFWTFEAVTRGPVESNGRACKILVSRVCDPDNTNDCSHYWHSDGILRTEFYAFHSIEITETPS